MSIAETTWLKALRQPGAVVFAVMFTLESFARATLLTVIPLQAYALLAGDKRDVSLLNLGVAMAGLVGSFVIPGLIRRWRRRWVYTGGAAAVIAAAGCLASVTLAGQAAGMLLLTLGTAAINITSNLYVMDYIRKRDLVHSEPLRLTFSAIAWTAGPSLGVYLNRQVGAGAAEALSALSAGALIAYFWLLRMRENPAVAAATRPPPAPLGSIRRFVEQPRLRLAWILPFGRSCWWAMFFVYPPIYMVDAGLPEAGAILVSVANAFLLLTPLVGRLAARIGLRRPMIVSFTAAGLSTILAAVFFASPILVAAAMLVGALACSALDAMGNIPFMRSVRPFERPQMTTVFRTYIDLSQLLPSAVFALLLSLFDLRAVFVATGLWMLVEALIARYLPRRF